jgi:hypothetical protein
MILQSKDNMYKRPIIRPRVLKGPSGPPRRVPTGAPGRVGEIATMMHRGSDTVRSPPPSKWRPSYDYEFVARHQQDPEEYLARTAEFFEQNPRPDRSAGKLAPAIDFAPIHELFTKYEGHRPPIEEHVAAMRKAGYAENVIAKAIARDALMKATVDERQEALDAIFARCRPSTSRRPSRALPSPSRLLKRK